MVESPAAAPARAGLKIRMLRAGSWVGSGQVVSYALRLGSNLILARLLAPEMFGVMAIVNVVSIVLTLLSDVGLGPSIVKSERGDRPEFLNTAWTLQIIRGGVIYLGALLVALGLFLANRWGFVPVSSTYAEPLLPALICVSSLSALITGFQSTKFFTAHRHLNMKGRFQLELMVQLASLFVMLVLAWFTRSIWAVVAGIIAGSVVHSLLTHFWLPGPRNRFHWDKVALTELLGFGRWVLLSSAVSVFAMNGDRILLGGLVGADILGVYSIAFTLAGIAQSVIFAIVSMVSLPAFSELAREAPEKVRAAYFQVRKFADSLVIVSAGFLCATAHALVHLLYDDRYHAAGTILQILSFASIISRFSMVQQVYLALGRSEYLVVMSAVQVVSLYIFVPTGFHLYGINGAVIAIAVKDCLIIPIIFYFNSRHNLNNFLFEIRILLFWPIGYAVGWCLENAIARLFWHAMH